MKKTINEKQLSCGMILSKHMNEFSKYTSESQKSEFINHVKELFEKNNAPADYAEEVITNLKRKSVKYGIIYLGDIIMAGMGLRSI